MFQGLFGWLRASVRAAVIGGVQDAVADLTTAPMDELPPVVLRLTFQPATTPEPEAEPARRKAK